MKSTIFLRCPFQLNSLRELMKRTSSVNNLRDRQQLQRRQSTVSDSQLPSERDLLEYGQIFSQAANSSKRYWDALPYLRQDNMDRTFEITPSKDPLSDESAALKIFEDMDDTEMLNYVKRGDLSADFLSESAVECLTQSDSENQKTIAKWIYDCCESTDFPVLHRVASQDEDLREALGVLDRSKRESDTDVSFQEALKYSQIRHKKHFDDFTSTHDTPRGSSNQPNSHNSNNHYFVDPRFSSPPRSYANTVVATEHLPPQQRRLFNT